METRFSKDAEELLRELDFAALGELESAIEDGCGPDDEELLRAIARERLAKAAAQRSESDEPFPLSFYIS